jgi:RNA polymerase sigma-70 factor (ECF subfamily)
VTAASPLAAERFRAIVPPLLDDAYSLAKWLCRNADDAQDIVQEAAVRALKALETTAVDRPKPWFLAIVRNAAMTWMARNRRKDLAFAGGLDDLDALRPADAGAVPDPETTLIAVEDGAGLRQAIAALPPPLLEILVMRDVNGLSYREIAEAAGLPMGTVMSRLARARGALAKRLKAEP